MFVTKTSWSDEELIKLMKLKECTKFSFGKIGKMMNRSRNSCAGAYFRIIQELNQSEAIK